MQTLAQSYTTVLAHVQVYLHFDIRAASGSGWGCAHPFLIACAH